MAMITAPAVRDQAAVAFHMTSGNTADADKDATDTLLLMHTIRTKTRTVITAVNGEMTRIHPRAVATPLPPSLHPKYKG